MSQAGKIFIIAGNHQQFLNYVRDKGNRPSFIYVSDVSMLKGYHQPHGMFIGTWYQREDLGEIIMQLRLASSISHDKAMEILDWRKKLKGRDEFSFFRHLVEEEDFEKLMTR
jgi:hypothetical protein